MCSNCLAFNGTNIASLAIHSSVCRQRNDKRYTFTGGDVVEEPKQQDVIQVWVTLFYSIYNINLEIIRRLIIRTFYV